MNEVGEVRFSVFMRQGALASGADLQPTLSQVLGEAEVSDMELGAGRYDCVATLRAESEGVIKDVTDALTAAGAEVDLMRQGAPEKDDRIAVEGTEDADYAKLAELRRENQSDPEWKAEALYWTDWSPQQTRDLGEFDRVVLAGADELALQNVQVTNELGWKTDWAWVFGPDGDQGPGPEGLATGKLMWGWRVVKTAWRVVGRINEAVDAYELIQEGRKLRRDYVEYQKRHPDPYEVLQRQRLHAAEVRERLTNTGPTSRRAYFRLFYARADRANRILQGGFG